MKDSLIMKHNFHEQFVITDEDIAVLERALKIIAVCGKSCKSDFVNNKFLDAYECINHLLDNKYVVPPSDKVLNYDTSDWD